MRAVVESEIVTENPTDVAQMPHSPIHYVSHKRIGRRLRWTVLRPRRAGLRQDRLRPLLSLLGKRMTRWLGQLVKKIGAVHAR